MTTAPSNYEVNISTLVAGALSLTAALAWNEAAKAGIQALYPQPTKNSFQAAMVYAIVVTIIVILVFTGLRAATKVANDVGNGVGNAVTNNITTAASFAPRPGWQCCYQHY